MNGTFDDGLPSASSDVGERLLQLEREGLVVDRRPGLGHLAQALAEDVALGPAFDRGDAVGRAHRRAVVELQAVAQREGVGQAVGADLVLVDHLRLDVELRVGREQHVVDHVAMVAGDVGRGPDRVEAAQVGLGHELQDLALREHRAGEDHAGGQGKAERQALQGSGVEGSKISAHGVRPQVGSSTRMSSAAQGCAACRREIARAVPHGVDRGRFDDCSLPPTMGQTGGWVHRGTYRDDRIRSAAARRPRRRGLRRVAARRSRGGGPMKIVAARMNHETNTFSPVPTPLASFGPDGPTFGAAALAQGRGTRTGLGAFIEAAAGARRDDRRSPATPPRTRAAASTTPPSRRWPAPSSTPCGRGCDLILLDLHGAMTTEVVRRRRRRAAAARARRRADDAARRRARPARQHQPGDDRPRRPRSSASRPTRTSTCTRPARTSPGSPSTGSTAAPASGTGLGAAAAAVAHAAQRHRRRGDAARGRARAGRWRPPDCRRRASSPASRSPTSPRPA